MTEHILPSPKDKPVNEKILLTEQTLGITSPQQRLLEARLFIDAPFFNTAIILGHPAPERIFGDEKWAGYLRARQFARVHGDKPLTPTFLIKLHRLLLERTHPNAGESIKDSTNPRGGTFVNGLPAPIVCSDEQIAKIEENPYLHWQPQPDEPNKGFIGYNIKTKHERVQKLSEITSWYNIEKGFPGHDPYELAARLQHMLISVHPFSIDYNGTISRISMNWSLENEGKNPSALDDSNADIFSSEMDWIKAVRKGSENYGDYKWRFIRKWSPLYAFRQHILEAYYTCDPANESLRTNPPVLATSDEWKDIGNHLKHTSEIYLLEWSKEDMYIKKDIL